MFFCKHRESSLIRKILEEFFGQRVMITTLSGNVEGIVSEVGVDYVEILEPEGTMVLVNFKSTLLVESV